MKDYKFRTENIHFNNTQTMDYFLNELFYNVFDEYSVVIFTDDSYAEIIDSEDHTWALHASGDGDFYNHKIRFELLNDGSVNL